MSQPCPTLAVAQICCDHRDALIRALQRDFPGACLGLVEDAVDAAALDALVGAKRPSSSFAKALLSDGEPGVCRLLKSVAWRHLRGHFRRSATRHETYPEAPPVAVSSARPDQHLDHLERLAELAGLIDHAARLHAKRNPAPLRDALHDAVLSGDSLVLVAQRNGVRREPLTNARTWVTRRLVG